MGIHQIEHYINLFKNPLISKKQVIYQKVIFCVCHYEKKPIQNIMVLSRIRSQILVTEGLT